MMRYKDLYQYNNSQLLKMMMIERSQEYEVEKILRKRSKDKEVWYLVKWKGYTEPQWIHKQQVVADDLIRKFERRIQFRKELKSYIGQKKKVEQVQAIAVIDLQSQQQVKKVVYTIQSSQQQQRQCGFVISAVPDNHQCETFSPNYQQKDERVDTVDDNNTLVCKKCHETFPPEQFVKQPNQALVEVIRYNYLKGVWQTTKKKKDELLTAAKIRQVYEQHQFHLPPLKIKKTFSYEDKEIVRFICNNKQYQASHEHIKKYRPQQLIEYYQQNCQFYKPKNTKKRKPEMNHRSNNQ